MRPTLGYLRAFTCGRGTVKLSLVASSPNQPTNICLRLVERRGHDMIPLESSGEWQWGVTCTFYRLKYTTTWGCTFTPYTEKGKGRRF